jgi:hypothetical protein
MADFHLPWESYPLFVLVALLYASVGHGGASGYLALFTLFGITTPAIAPIALVLNIIVASTSFWHYRANGHFSVRVLIPFITLSIPFAFIGGALHISERLFALILGIALMMSALRIITLRGNKPNERQPSDKTLWLFGLPIGAILGMLSGITGIGGGVFLSPVLVLTGWASVKQSAALASAFIVVNSTGGLVGQLTRTSLRLDSVLPLVAVVVIGGAIGSYLGATRLPQRWLQVILSIVLLSAGTKLLLRSF